VAALLALPSFSSLQLLQQEEQKDVLQEDLSTSEGPADTFALLHQARVRVMHLLSVAAEQELLAAYEALRPGSGVFQFTNEVRAYACLYVHVLLEAACMTMPGLSLV